MRWRMLFRRRSCELLSFAGSGIHDADALVEEVGNLYSVGCAYGPDSVMSEIRYRRGSRLPNCKWMVDLGN